MQLLIFTKVPLYEESFELQLKQLGNEVYCSNRLIDLLKQGRLDDDFFSKFEGIIFSETLYDKEVEEICRLLPRGEFKIFRRSSEAELEKTSELFDAWLPLDSTLDNLRELLLIAEMSQLAFKNANLVQQITVKQKLSDLNLKLKQKEIVYYLIQSGDRTVPREEISRQIWEKEPTKSVLASLSKVVSKVNEKLAVEFGDEAIQTVWGQGYRLNKKIFDYLENDLMEKELISIRR